MMELIKELVKKDIVRRILILTLVGILLYFLREMINLFLLTFIFAFLLNSIQKFLSLKIKRIVRVKQRVMIVFLYAVMAVLITYFFSQYIPLLIQESKAIFVVAQNYYFNPNGNPFAEFMVSLINQLDLMSYVGTSAKFLIQYITDISKISMDFVLSIILSLIFLLEKNRIMHFVARFKTSSVAFIYNEIEYFGSKFVLTFGKVLQAQVVIAMINTVLSVIVLWVLGFPHIPFLAAMIFVLGLIPVAGVFISLVPLSILAFSNGGFIKVIYMIVMISLLHGLEAYILNPKLMSVKTELPVFFTFLVLFASESMMGVWGLIIGIPLFIFLLDLLSVNREGLNKKAKNCE